MTLGCDCSGLHLKRLASHIKLDFYGSVTTHAISENGNNESRSYMLAL